LGSALPSAAQYFGRNKVQYEKFDFKVLKTDHFDIYYYPEEEASVRLAARMAERWHARLTRLLQHELSGRQPLILYAAHPHFEQTNILDEVGEGTGGVTESNRRRVILPSKVEQNWAGNGFHITYHCEQQLTAIDGVFHMLDGKGVMRENKGPLVKAINATDQTGRGETEYFRFRCCKNRNLHLEFKRLDLVKQLNGLAAGEYVLGEDVE